MITMLHCYNQWSFSCVYTHNDWFVANSILDIHHIALEQVLYLHCHDLNGPTAVSIPV